MRSFHATTSEPRVLALPMTAAYFRLILRRFGETKPVRRTLLDGTDRDASVADAVANPDGEISVGAQVRQLANLDRVAPAGWGLDLGATLDVATHGPAGLVAVTAPSLGGALDAVARYLTVRTPFVDLRVTRDRERYTLRVVEPCDLGRARVPLLEMVLLSLQATIESALGRRMHHATFVMPSARPAYWRRYDQVFHAPVAFTGAEAAVSLPAEWLELPCPLADTVLHRGTCARLESMRQRLAGDFVDVQVARLLESGDDAGLSLGATAVRLRMSPRTLVRRLGRRNASYRELLDAHRRARAAELLAQAQLSVAEIADRLGYDEPTNFSRACRRWFGVSPRSYRR